MGRGSYTASDWDKLRTTRGITSAATADNLFRNNRMLDKYNPRFINMRESRDNDEHPHSTPIAIGVDVTGSMGYLSEQIVKNSLNELMKKLYASNVIPDPQLMFGAIGDAKSDMAPLQVTQFESDIRIAEQLMELWIEGAGGDSPEDYQLLWYFLAKHTDIDCFNKRGKKGFCFTIGDAAFHDSVTGGNIKAIFNDDAKLYRTSELAKMASEKYELFHIDLNAGKMSASKYIPGRVISVSPSEVKYLPEIIIAAIQLISGKNNDDILNGLDFSAKQVVSRAVSTLNVGGSIKL